MGVSYLGAGAATKLASPATATIATPSGTGSESGPEDYLILVWTARGTSCTPSTPTGWTLIANHDYTNNRVYIFGRRVVESIAEPQVTVTGTGTNQTMIAQCFAFGGVNDETPIQVAPTWTDTASAQNGGPLTAVSSTAADAGALAINHKADDWTSVTVDGSFTEISEDDSTLGTDAGISVAWKKMPTAASTGTMTSTATGGAANTWTGCILILGARTGVTTNEAGFELGTSGNTIVPNSATCPELSINSGSGSAVFSNAQAHRGTLSALINPTAGSHRLKFNNAIPGPIMYVRAYYYMTDTTPASPLRIMECEDYPGTPIGSIALSTAGLIRVQTSGGTNIVNSAVTMSINTWYRLELCCNVTANTTTARIYTGAQLEAVGTDYTGTCQTSVTAGIPWAERCLAGAGTAEATNIYVDDFAYSTADWLGPALVIPRKHRLAPGVPVGQSSRW